MIASGLRLFEQISPFEEVRPSQYRDEKIVTDHDGRDIEIKEEEAKEKNEIAR